MPEPAEVVAVKDQAALLVRNAVLGAIERGHGMTPAIEAHVHRAVDLLRSTQADPLLLLKIEAISCALLKMWHIRQEGRVNLYASRLLRLRSAAHAL